MVFLGIDPGTIITGFGIIKKEGNRSFLLDYGALSMKSSQTIPERIFLFHNFLKNKIEEYSITHVSIETPFLGKNAQNFLKLGYLRGIVYLLAEQYKLKIQEFSPREIKLSLTGFGGADKDQVARIVSKFFPNINIFKSFDITDAIAVTLCGVWRHKNLLLK